MGGSFSPWKDVTRGGYVEQSKEVYGESGVHLEPKACTCGSRCPRAYNYHFSFMLLVYFIKVWIITSIEFKL